MIEELHITSREQWLALRAQDVTASAAGALLGCHEYVSKFDLWSLKSGRAAEDAEETPPMRRGRLLEPVALALLRELRPEWTIGEPRRYYRDTEHRLGATPDLFAVAPGRPGFGIVQIKTVEPGVFRRKWRGEDGFEVEPPLWIVVQACLEAHLAGATWAVVAAMTVGFGVEMHLVEVPLHPDLIDRLREESAAFWKLVDSGEPPPFDFAHDADAIKALYPEDTGLHLDLTSDNRMPELAAERARHSRAKKDAEEALKAINAEILAKVGPAAAATFAGGTLTAKTINRRAYEVKASSYRALRVKLDAGNDED